MHQSYRKYPFQGFRPNSLFPIHSVVISNSSINATRAYLASIDSVLISPERISARFRIQEQLLDLGWSLLQ